MDERNGGEKTAAAGLEGLEGLVELAIVPHRGQGRSARRECKDRGRWLGCAVQVGAV